MFETEMAIALATAQIAQVVTLFPGRDAYTDHTEAAIARQPFILLNRSSQFRTSCICARCLCAGWAIGY
jgi:hypothetical protein